MAITINNFSIINSGQGIAVDVETNIGSIITSAKIWKMNDFKSSSLAIDLADKLEQINNKEIFIVSSDDLSVDVISDIYFIELTDDYEDDEECSTCQEPALGITYDLTPYYQCVLSSFLESDCTGCNEPINNMVITTSLSLDMIEKAIEVGFYAQAINLVNRVKKLCSLRNCTNCLPIDCDSCGKFKQY